jgi:hypothetical protein
MPATTSVTWMYFLGGITGLRIIGYGGDFA